MPPVSKSGDRHETGGKRGDGKSKVVQGPRLPSSAGQLRPQTPSGVATAKLKLHADWSSRRWIAIDCGLPELVSLTTFGRIMFFIMRAQTQTTAAHPAIAS